MLKYFCKTILLLSFCFANAQETKKDTIAPKPKTTRYGLRVGIDAVKFTKSFFEKDYKGLELVGDFKLSKKYYLAAEIGNENKTVVEDHFSFNSKGTYIKAGFDYNLYENWLGMQNMTYVGLRYGVSTFSKTLYDYTIYNRNQYFSPSPNYISNEKFDGLSAQWLEVVGGIKAEVFTNLYLGFSVRLNYLVSASKPDNFESLYIPGYNRTYGGKFGFGLNYTVSYFLPLYKKVDKVKIVKSK